MYLVIFWYPSFLLLDHKIITRRFILQVCAAERRAVAYGGQ